MDKWSVDIATQPFSEKMQLVQNSWYFQSSYQEWPLMQDKNATYKKWKDWPLRAFEYYLLKWYARHLPRIRYSSQRLYSTACLWKQSLCLTFKCVMVPAMLTPQPLSSLCCHTRDRLLLLSQKPEKYTVFIPLLLANLRPKKKKKWGGGER